MDGHHDTRVSEGVSDTLDRFSFLCFVEIRRDRVGFLCPPLATGVALLFLFCVAFLYFL